MIRQLLIFWVTLMKLAFSRQRTVSGVSVRFLFVTPEDRELALQRLADAVRLLTDSQPRPRPVWRGYIKRVFVWPTGMDNANWYDPLRLCTVDVGFLVNPNTAIRHIAATLVHEAQHARVCRLGARYTPATRARTENLCLQAEIDFLETVPGSESSIHRLRQLQADIPRFWDAKQRLDRGLTDLRELGTPEWIVRIVNRLARKRAV